MNGIEHVTSVTQAIAKPAIGGARAAGEAAPGADATGFGDAIKRALDQVNAMQTDADVKAQAVQMGEPDASLESSMVAIAKANVAFQTAVQVRNRLVSAYHDLMNMQV